MRQINSKRWNVDVCVDECWLGHVCVKERERKIEIEIERQINSERERVLISECLFACVRE